MSKNYSVSRVPTTSSQMTVSETTSREEFEAVRREIERRGKSVAASPPVRIQQGTTD